MSTEQRLPVWMNLKSAAEYCGYSVPGFCRLVKEGLAPPSVKISTHARRFRVRDLDAWIEAGGQLAKRIA